MRPDRKAAWDRAKAKHADRLDKLREEIVAARERRAETVASIKCPDLRDSLKSGKLRNKKGPLGRKGMK